MARVWDIKKLKDLSEEEKKQLLKDAYDLGYRYEHDYHGCSQASFAALQELFGISEPMVFKAACGFAGGLGGSCQEICGGLSGTCLFYSMLYGRERDNFDDPHRYRFIAYAGCSKIRNKYIEEWGSTRCKEVMMEAMHRKGKGRRWFNLVAAPEELEEFEKIGGHTVAADVVGKACSWTVEAIIEKETEGQLS